MLLKLLRNFGHLIKILGISYWNLNAKICAEIERNYLAKYCSDSLERLYLDCDYSKAIFEHLQEPLKKLTTLGVRTCTTRYLNDKKLPNLRHMIYVHSGCSVRECEDIHYKNIEYFHLLPMPQMNKFPFSFENLKHFEINGNFEVNDAFCKLIENIKYLKTLKLITGTCDISADCFKKVFEIQNILLNVVEIEIRFRKSLSSELILEFLKQSKSLKKIHFVLFSGRIYDNEFDLYSKVMQSVTSHLGSEWTTCIITPPKPPYYSFTEQKYYTIKR